MDGVARETRAPGVPQGDRAFSFSRNSPLNDLKKKSLMYLVVYLQIISVLGDSQVRARQMLTKNFRTHSMRDFAESRKLE